jgi:RHS repeat-associated protein
VNAEGMTIAFIGNHTEWNVTNQEMTRYYLAGGQRVAFRVIKSGQTDKVFYLLADHLGSTNVVMQVGGVVERTTYTAWGELRTGSINSTDRQYTGQINESELGLYFYNARYYDPDLGRFISADTIVPQPGNPQDWDRFSYVQNNPINFYDPSGHCYDMVDGQLSPRCQAYWKEYSPEIIKSQLSRKFGVKLQGYSTKDAINMLKALNYLDNALGGISQFTQGRTFSFRSDPKYYGGITSPSGDIAFHATAKGSPYQNIYHELAHLINFASNDFFVSLLNSYEVFDPEGVFVMGGPDLNYNRNSLGYLNNLIKDPSGIYADAQQHPGSINCASGDDWCISGNTASEEWADLIANYVSNNFDNSPNGMTRRTWVEQAFLNYKLSVSGYIGGGY